MDNIIICVKNYEKSENEFYLDMSKLRVNINLKLTFVAGTV